MKKLNYILLIILVTTSLRGQEKGLGLGIIIGEPTGLSGKYWISTTNAVDVQLAYSFTNENNKFFLISDFLWHKNLYTMSGEKIPWHYGVGITFRAIEKGEDAMGIHGVTGLSWYLKSAPIDIFIEIGGIMSLIPKTSFDLTAGIGARYFF